MHVVRMLKCTVLWGGVQYSVYIALDMVGSEFSMAFGVLNLFKPPAVNISISSPNPITLYVTGSQVNLRVNIKMDQRHSTG